MLTISVQLWAKAMLKVCLYCEKQGCQKVRGEKKKGTIPSANQQCSKGSKPNTTKVLIFAMFHLPFSLKPLNHWSPKMVACELTTRTSLFDS